MASTIPAPPVDLSTRAIESLLVELSAADAHRREVYDRESTIRYECTTEGFREEWRLALQRYEAAIEAVLRAGRAIAQRDAIVQAGSVAA
jgi:hypothetical protein